MADFFSYISSWSVLKWIVLVLIAGFIGQFGKMSAEAIVRKIRARRAGKETSSDASKEAPKPSPPSPSSPSVLPSTGEMADKKLLKAMVKARKKEAKKNG